MEPFELFPATDQQEGIWLHAVTHGTAYWNFIVTKVYRADLDIRLLKAALERTLQRHSSLRTHFVWSGSALFQAVNKDSRLDQVFRVLEHQNDDPSYISEQTGLEAAREERYDFDFERGPLLRCLILKFPGTASIILTVNHIITDSWSMQLFWEELYRYYRLLRSGNELPSSMPSLQYAEYAAAQKQFSATQAYQDQRDYWLGRLAGDWQPLNLSWHNHTAPAALYHKQGDLPRKLAEDIRSSSLKRKVLYASVFQLAYFILLYKYSNVSRIAVCNVVHGRGFGKKNYRDVMGLFAKRLVNSISIQPGDTLRQLLTAVHEDMLASFQYSDVPYEVLARDINKRDQTGQKPLSSAVFNLIKEQKAGMNPEDGFEDFLFPGSGSGQEGDLQYDIGLSLEEAGDGFRLRIDLKCEKTFAPMAALLWQRYLEIVQTCVYQPQLEVQQLDGLPAAEQVLLAQYSYPERDFPREKSLVHLWREQVSRTPEQPALWAGELRVSYRELDRESDRLTGLLRKKGIGPGSLVAVCMERSAALLTGLLGILKAGGAYIPIDPSYPQERITYMLSDARPSVILCSRKTRTLNPSGLPCAVLLPDAWEMEPALPVPVPPGPADRAYVVYTSGSTGRPKGVVVGHKSIVNLVSWHQRIFGVTGQSRALSVASIGFDAFGWEIWPYLTKGAAVWLAEEEQRTDPTELHRICIRHRITHCFIPTPLAPAFIACCREASTDLQYILTGGDRLHWKEISLSPCRVVNNYGPTEDTVVSTSYELPADMRSGFPPIGRPVDNHRLYILNDRLELCPIGVEGELYIGGEGLAEGYLNQPGLTEKRFIANPFPEEKGGRIYRTGDLCRWLPDGNIEYLGRQDRQVKIRGNRIEPGEIETILQQYPGTKEVIVLARTDEQGNKRLVAYVTGHDQQQRAALQVYLQERLPAFMIPAFWVFLPALPLTVNGKVDSSALPEPDIQAEREETLLLPRNEVETALAECWQELLGLSRVGIRDNFFELGGDSIIAIQVASRVLRSGHVLRPRDIFQYQTIEKLAAIVAGNVASGALPPSEQGVLSGACDLLPIQLDYLEREASNPKLSHYNQSLLTGIDKRVGPEQLSAALHALALHHDALRFVYTSTTGGWRQTYGEALPELIVRDLRAENMDVMPGLITWLAAGAQCSPDIEKGRLVSATLLLTPQADPCNRLFLVIHHLAVDGVSWRIIQDFLEAALADPLPNPLLPALVKTSSYRDWRRVLGEYSRSRRLLSQLPYWKELTAGSIPLPHDKPADEGLTCADLGTAITCWTATKTRQLLQSTPAAYHTEINDLLLAALAKTLGSWSGRQKILVGLEGHGREEHITQGIDLSRTIGWFTSLFPVLLEWIPRETNEDLISNCKESLRRIPDKGLGYGVLKYISRAEELSGVQPWEAVFNYMGQIDNALAQSRLFHPATEDTGSRMSELHTVREKLSVNCWVSGGVLEVHWGYSRKHYHEDTIAQLARAYLDNLEELTLHCIRHAEEGGSTTPSDHGLGDEIRYRELDIFRRTLQAAGLERPVSISRLSPAQEGMLFHSLYDQDSKAYLTQLSCQLTGIRPELLIKSWEHLAERYSILRSSFHRDLSIPVRCTFKEIVLPVQLLDYRSVEKTKQQEMVRRYEEDDRSKGFDLSRPPLLRLTLIRLDADVYRMIWTSHHILLDGWSIAILRQSLQLVYERLQSGLEPFPEKELPYEDYIDFISRRSKEDEETYYRQLLSDIERPSLLPFIGNDATRNKGIGVYSWENLALGHELTAAVSRYIHLHQLTASTLMQGVWAYLLYRYTGEKTVVFGITVSGRPAELAYIEQRVGLYINTLPLRVDIREDMTLGDWLQRIQEDQTLLHQYQHARLSDIQQYAGKTGDLFDSILVFENYPVDKSASAKSMLQMEQTQMHEQTNYPLTIAISASADMHIGFNYNTRLLDSGTIGRIAGHFKEVLASITGQQVLPGQLPLLTTGEEDLILKKFNDAALSYPHDKTLVQLLEEQCARFPGRTAVVCGQDRLTFAELALRSNQLGNFLRRQGLGKDQPVAICLDRSIELIVAIVAVLKAGGAYVPIDPGYPRERKGYILADTGAAFLLTAGPHPDGLPPLAVTRMMMILMEDEAIRQEPDSLPPVDLEPSTLAYILYTSGSTGRPKGVMIEHRNIVALLYSFEAIAGEDRDGTGLSLCPAGFDVSAWEFFINLCRGGTLHLLKEEALYDPAFLAHTLIVNKITTAYIPPTLLADIAGHLETFKSPLSLRRLLVGVMPIRQDLLQRWKDLVPGLQIINGYGPTETTVCATFFLFTRCQPTSLYTPIGGPAPGYQVYLLDQQRRPVPIGLPGEIYIAGAGVGRGYLNRPDLTAEKFVLNIFSSDPGSRLYATGDLAKWKPDGTLEYLGRIDEQIKISGHRIEPGEIEALLHKSGHVKQAAVTTCRVDGKTNDALVAYVVPEGAFDRRAVKEYLQAHLPFYMIPSIWVALDVMPVTSIGKTDKRKLPLPGMSELENTGFMPPRTATESALAGIWGRLLRREAIGLYDDFFALGGHSLQAMQVVTQVENEFNLKITVRNLFNFPVLEDLAAYIDVLQGNNISLQPDAAYAVLDL